MVRPRSYARPNGRIGHVRLVESAFVAPPGQRTPGDKPRPTGLDKADRSFAARGTRTTQRARLFVEYGRLGRPVAVVGVDRLVRLERWDLGADRRGLARFALRDWIERAGWPDFVRREEYIGSGNQ